MPSMGSGLGPHLRRPGGWGASGQHSGHHSRARKHHAPSLRVDAAVGVPWSPSPHPEPQPIPVSVPGRWGQGAPGSTSLSLPSGPLKTPAGPGEAPSQAWGRPSGAGGPGTHVHRHFSSEPAFWIPAEEVQEQQWLAKALGGLHQFLFVLLQNSSGRRGLHLWALQPHRTRLWVGRAGRLPSEHALPPSRMTTPWPASRCWATA